MEIIISFIQRAILQGTPLLFGATGEILTEKSGNLNLGIPGIMYIGAISGVVGGFFYQNSAARVQPVPAILIPLLCCLAGSLLTSLLYCFLTVTLKANQNVTGLAITTFGVGVGNFFGGSLIKIVKSDVPYLALVKIAKAYKTTLPFASGMGPIGQLFFSYGFLVYLAVILAVAVSLFLSRSRAGLYLRAVGENPATADAGGKVFITASATAVGSPSPSSSLPPGSPPWPSSAAICLARCISCSIISMSPCACCPSFRCSLTSSLSLCWWRSVSAKSGKTSPPPASAFPTSAKSAEPTRKKLPRPTSGGVSYISYKLFKGGENRSGFTLRVSSEHRLSLSAGFRSPWHQIKKTPQCISSQTTPIGGKDSVKENRQGCLSRFIRAQASF